MCKATIDPPNALDPKESRLLITKALQLMQGALLTMTFVSLENVPAHVLEPIKPTLGLIF
jgi:hypothetical protein